MKLYIEYTKKGQIKDHVSSISIPLTEDTDEGASFAEATIRLYDAIKNKTSLTITVG